MESPGSERAKIVASVEPRGRASDEDESVRGKPPALKEKYGAEWPCSKEDELSQGLNQNTLSVTTSLKSCAEGEQAPTVDPDETISPWINAVEYCSSNEVSWREQKDQEKENDIQMRISRLKSKYSKRSAITKHNVVTPPPTSKRIDLKRFQNPG